MSGLLIILGCFMFVFGLFSIIVPKRVLYAMFIIGIRNKEEYSHSVVSSLVCIGLVSLVIGLLLILTLF